MNLGYAGSWSEWQDITNCSKTCGDGTKTKARKCDNVTSIETRELLCRLMNGSYSKMEYEDKTCKLSTCPES